MKITAAVSDRPGVLAEVVTLASRLHVDLQDVEIGRSTDGASVVASIVLASGDSDRYVSALQGLGYVVT